MRLPDPREKPWLSVGEVAQITGEGEKAIRHALDAGQLPMLRIGRYVRIPTHQLLELVGLATLPGTDMHAPNMSEDPAPTGSIATADEVSGGPRHAQHDTRPLRRA